MTKLKNSNFDKTRNCDQTQKLNWWQNFKKNGDKTQKLKLWEKIQKLKLWQNPEKQIVTKLKNSNCDQTKKLKL